MTDKVIVAVVGSVTPSKKGYELAMELGKALVDNGFLIVTGGLNGIMEAVSRGARRSKMWSGREILGITPGWDREKSNPWVDIEIDSGLGRFRNTLLVNVCNVVIGIEGGSGTLSELALAWQEGKPICCLDTGTGWSSILGSEKLDARRLHPILKSTSIENIANWLDIIFPKGSFNIRGCLDWYHGTVPCIHRVYQEIDSVLELQSHFGMVMHIEQLKEKLTILEKAVVEENHTTQQERKALVTFDDGYRDVLILKDYFKDHPYLQPVLFIPSSFIVGDGQGNWFDLFYHLLCHSDKESSNHISNLDYFDPIEKEKLREMTWRSQIDYLKNFASERKKDFPVLSELYLTKDDIRHLVDSGWYIGSHGHYHHNLTLLEDEELEDELQRSLEAVLEVGGLPWLAYPDGQWNEKIVETALCAGFTRMFTIDNGLMKGIPQHVERTLWMGDIIETN
ncbi:polysaccharide deacetylase family protein [Methanomethylovorans sp.]|uniref:SLOG cluster 4 domain-containing protein n=1 Tax=Methanomethylovorans sp. TaxID=2758717 RepID=UPI00345E243D